MSIFSYSITPSGDVVLVLSRAQARGLLAFAGEGAEGLLADKGAAKAYIGARPAVVAAESALEALRKAVAVADGVYGRRRKS